MKILYFLFILTAISISCVSSQEVIVIGNESMPWNGIVDGKPDGIFVDVLIEAEKYGAPSFTFNLGLPWVRAQNLILDGPADPTVIIPLSRTPVREYRYMWISDVVIDDISLISLKPNDGARTLEEARNMRVGVINGHVIIPTLEALGFENIHTSTNIDQIIMMLRNGRIDAICEGSYCMIYSWKENGFDPEELNFGYVVSRDSKSYVAANPDFPPELAERISGAIDEMRRNGRFDAIMDKWRH